MIDHIYILLKVNDFHEITVDAYEHRVNAINEAIKAAPALLGSDYKSLVIPEEARVAGLDLVLKAKHGPAVISITRRVPS